MRIAYGVFGYGRGHASRAQCLLPQLTKRHELLVLAGADAWEALSPIHPVVAIPSMEFVYRGAKLSAWGTLRKNLPHVRDALLGGEGARQVERALRSFRPDVVVSDAEPWTHQAASRLGIPRISLDHYYTSDHGAAERRGEEGARGDPWTRVAKRYYLRGLMARLREEENPRPRPRCVALRSHVRILPDGAIPVCQFNGERIGNLAHHPFADVWHGEGARRARRWIDTCRGCWAECEVIPSALYTGDILRGVL